ncbi:Na/Pi cotransporter family protein [Lachnoanaerobaculum umeaense]|uniref:Na/Pi cotransporter family protein n=1 Tax=Lachnoanaerobaculum umeaense TaxID=617123 RepID=A0A385PY18_9FIRM|nr:Na/Pi cotransporter family protein [Lachnoanaerobaculum umeaense]AYA98489.1 Na/Pi cotransporter family protein [Lachnoanaerobaculum umeaense]PZW93535.1 phosphate:Na+ symporter [Lachnoanaerobaculum umeaense]
MIEKISYLFGFVGGLGMFLYGMHIMADGMQKTAGGKMQHFLSKITDNRVTAIMLGALITAIIQSSGATTVMVVGFVSAGVLTLVQAVGVIMGANIGTTITAWVVSIGTIGESMELLKPGFYAPVLIGIGAGLIIFTKSDKKKTIGEILIGLGMLFMGLDLMAGNIKPFTTLPIFSEAFRVLGGNPILGIIVGIVVTALMQSSSASVGILQTLAFNGVVTTSAAIYITLGQNIGSCVTAIISSMGSSRTAKRAAAIHLLFNAIGAIVFGILGFVVFSINTNLANHTINAVEISLFHTLFNFTMTSLLFPFANLLVKLSGMIVIGKNDEVVEEAKEPVLQLDERVLLSPAFAVQTANNEVARMGNIALKSLKAAISAINTKSIDDIETVAKCEKTLDDMQEALTKFLIKVDNLSLSESQKKHINNLFNMVTDIERVGDHADNISENAKYMIDNNLEFSDLGKEDLAEISKDSIEAFEIAINASAGDALRAVRKVNKLEDKVDMLEDEFREKHIERLSKGDCHPQSGIAFLDIISNLERISDHATNIVGYVKNEI